MLALLLALGILYALPNLYGEHFALQISGEKGGPVAEEIFREIGEELADKQVGILKSSFDHGKVLFRFNDSESQLKAKRVVSELLDQLFEKYPTLKDRDFQVAQNQEIVLKNRLVTEGEIALLPPFSGG